MKKTNYKNNKRKKVWKYESIETMKLSENTVKISGLERRLIILND